MVRQQRVENSKDYEGLVIPELPPLAKHIWDLRLPEITFTEDDIISPTGSYEVETSGDECNRVTKIYFVRRGLFNINNQIKTLISTFVWRNPYCKKEEPVDIYDPANFGDPPNLIAYCADGSHIEPVFSREYNYRGRIFDGGTPAREYIKFAKDEAITMGVNHIESAYEYAPNKWRNLKLEPRWSNWSPGSFLVLGKFKNDALIDTDPYTVFETKIANLWVVGERFSVERNQWEFHEGLLIYYATVFRFISPPCDPKAILPPPPPPDECCKNMSCCPKNDNLEQLLRLILKRIGTPQTVTIFDEDMDREGAQKAKKTPESLNHYLKLAVERTEIANRLIGIENYPVTVPDTIIEPYQEGIFSEVFNFLSGKKDKKIKTLTEFLAWQIEQDSATTGQFHQVFEFEVKEGEKETVVIPNIAEALKEILILNSQMARQTNVLIESAFRTLTELVATKTQVCRNVAITQDIQDYLDYPTTNKVEEIDVAINIPGYVQHKDLGNGFGIIEGISGFGEQEDSHEDKKENHEEYLRDGKARFNFEDWTGENSFHDQLMDLLQVASMLRAILYQRVDKDK